jgi:small-conductance mechanosensitive channel
VIGPDLRSALWAVATVLVAGLGALLLVEIVHRVARRLGRRSALLSELAAQAHRPVQLVACLFAVYLGVGAVVATSTAVRDELLHFVLLALIGAGAWLLAALLLVFEDVALSRYRTDVPDNLRRRRLHTQVVMLRRVTVAVVVVLATAVALMTFPAVRAVGTSVLASAGIIGIIGGLAAQSMLSNVFAGLQLTFSDAIRLDDVVVVEGEWGKIEEITLTHVVVRIWDDRRLIVPTSRFTTQPFEHWTRTQAAVLGTVELGVDWSVPVEAMREKLRAVLDGTDLWDGREGVLQVTDAVGGGVTVRVLVSAVDAGTLWDLRCHVREQLVAWVRDREPAALPRLRAEVARPAAGPAAGAPRAPREAPGDARVFGGSAEKEARGEEFGGPEDGSTGGGEDGADGGATDGAHDGAGERAKSVRHL